MRELPLVLGKKFSGKQGRGQYRVKVAQKIRNTQPRSGNVDGLMGGVRGTAHAEKIFMRQA